MERCPACLQGQRVCKDVNDTLLWSTTKSGKFTIKSLHNVLELDVSRSFPISGIWLSWVQPRVSFFAWEAM